MAANKWEKHNFSNESIVILQTILVQQGRLLRVLDTLTQLSTFNEKRLVVSVRVYLDYVVMPVIFEFYLQPTTSLYK